MTYWPISSPSVFAATKNTNLARTPVSHDGTDEASQDGRDGASEAETESTNETDDTESTEGEEEVKEEGKEQKARQTNSLDQFAEDDVHGEIIAIRVTRSGQLFATLTRTTLTIWQTKVRQLLLCRQMSLIKSTANGHTSFSAAVSTVIENLWPKYRRPPPTRLSDFCSPDYSRFPHHVLPCDRPLVPRLQDTIHRHTWNTFTEDQHCWV
jgi:hypothetical protein